MNNKPWNEKLGVWITIIAGICGILGISVFGSKSLIRNSETENALASFESNEISIEDQSAVVIGDNNTFNYGNVYSDSPYSNESNELFISEINDFQ